MYALNTQETGFTFTAAARSLGRMVWTLNPRDARLSVVTTARRVGSIALVVVALAG